MRSGRLAYFDLGFVLFSLLSLAGAAGVGWWMGRDGPAAGVPGYLVTPVGGFVCWVLALWRIVRLMTRDRRLGRRRLTIAAVVVAVLAASPPVARFLNQLGLEAGARYQYRIADLAQVRRDCADLIRANSQDPITYAIHYTNPAFNDLPESVRKLNPFTVRIRDDHVVITRLGMIAHRREIIIVPEGSVWKPQQGESRITDGVYRLKW